MNRLRSNQICHGVSMLGIALLSGCSGGVGSDSTSGDGWRARDDGKLSVEFENLSDGDEVTGTQTVGFAIGGGSGDRQIAVSVEGAAQETLDSEPWEWGWDTTGLEFGEYTISATAEDGSGATASAQVTAFAGAPEKWTRLVGGSSKDQASDVAVHSGHVYVAGITSSDFGGQTSTGLSRDVYLAKYDPSGTRNWVRMLGSNGPENFEAVTTDGSGNVYVAGSTEKGFAGRSYKGGLLDGFVAKFDADGSREWVRMVGASESESARGLTTDESGNLYVVGQSDEAFLGRNYKGGRSDGFVTKYDRAGTRRWLRSIGSSGVDAALGVVTDRAGGLYVTGLTDTGVDGQTYNGGRSDGMVAKFSQSGDQRWVRLIGGDDSDSAVSAAATSKAVYVTGVGVREDGFVAQYDQTGARKWIRPVGFSTTKSGHGAWSVSADATGHLYVAGDTAEGFGGQTYNGQRSDGFVAEFDPSGERTRVELIGTNSNDSAVGVAAAGPGVFYVAGRTSRNTESLAGRPYNGGTFDAFLVKRSW